MVLFVIILCFVLETKEVYEGEVTELSPVETENPVGGFSKTVSHVVIGKVFLNFIWQFHEIKILFKRLQISVPVLFVLVLVVSRLLYFVTELVSTQLH
jgi:hypothetical protein